MIVAGYGSGFARKCRELLTELGRHATKWGVFAASKMSEEQFSAFLQALKTDTALQEKLKGAADFDAGVAIAKEAGFDVNKADWLKHQASSDEELELGDEELANISGGQSTFGISVGDQIVVRNMCSWT